MADPYLLFEPLADWMYPERARVASPFSATWATTKGELLREAAQLRAPVVVIEVGVERSRIRKNGQLRADTRVEDPRVRITMDTKHGAVRLASDRYRGHGLIWQHNVRAAVLTLGSLRAVERYGAVRDGQQYAGFLAIEAGPAAAAAFPSADSALRWMDEQAGGCAPHMRGADIYCAAARRLHPDRGGDRDLWDLLTQARTPGGRSRPVVNPHTPDPSPHSPECCAAVDTATAAAPADEQRLGVSQA